MYLRGCVPIVGLKENVMPMMKTFSPMRIIFNYRILIKRRRKMVEDYLPTVETERQILLDFIKWARLPDWRRERLVVQVEEYLQSSEMQKTNGSET